MNETLLTFGRILDGDFRGDLAGDLTKALRDLEGENGRLVGDSDRREGVLVRAERGVAASCGDLGEGGGKHGVSEVVAMLTTSRVLCVMAQSLSWTRC